MTENVADYVKDIARWQREGTIKPGQVIQVDVYHDDNCGIWKGGPCDCKPDLVAKKGERQRENGGQ